MVNDAWDIEARLLRRLAGDTKSTFREGETVGAILPAVGRLLNWWVEFKLHWNVGPGQLPCICLQAHDLCSCAVCADNAERIKVGDGAAEAVGDRLSMESTFAVNFVEKGGGCLVKRATPALMQQLLRSNAEHKAEGGIIGKRWLSVIKTPTEDAWEFNLQVGDLVGKMLDGVKPKNLLDAFPLYTYLQQGELMRGNAISHDRELAAVREKWLSQSLRPKDEPKPAPVSTKRPPVLNEDGQPDEPCLGKFKPTPACWLCRQQDECVERSVNAKI
jgi:hypothetical protein